MKARHCRSSSNDKERLKTEYIQFEDEQILTVRYKTLRWYKTFVVLCSPEDANTEESEEFYRLLQTYVNNINRNGYIILAEGFNQF